MRIAMLGLMIAVVLTADARAVRADDTAAAEAEFVRAKKLKKEGKVADACEAFARSAKLDPQFGTKYNLALCYQELGKLASAWVIYRDLAQRDTNSTRKKDSAQRAEKLEPKLTKLLVTTRTATPGLKVTRDGVDVTHVMGIEDPIDPGRYHIVASAEGYESWESDVEVAPGKGATITVDIPPLERPSEGTETPGGTATPPGDETPPIGEESPPRDESPAAAPGRGRRIAGYSIAGAGAVALGVSVVFGLKARSSWDEVVALCGDDLDCPSETAYVEAQGLVDDTRSAGNLSTVLVGAGIVAVAAGVFLAVTAPSGGEVERAEPEALRLVPQVGADGVGVVAAGVF